MDQKIVLGTRGSELALRQAKLVAQALQSRWPNLKIETKIVQTKGDQTKIVDPRAGWKGLFTAEIERALLSGDIDLAVHSAKDLPSEMDPGARIGAVLPRAPTNDTLISKRPGGLAGLPKKATVATSSVRRKYQLLWQRPDLSVVDLRGNVPTRLRKLAENDWDAIVLARAGLERLGLSTESLFADFLPQEIFLPAGGQGTIAVQIRTDDAMVKAIVDPVNDREAELCLRAEREFLRLLNVDCNAPVGVLATVDGDMMKIRAQFFTDGLAAPREAGVEGARDQGELLAVQVADRLRAGA